MLMPLVTPPKISWEALATVPTGLTSVWPEDCTPMNENMKPRRRARMASPTFMWNMVAKIAQEPTVVTARPIVHQRVGTWSSGGEGSSFSGSTPVVSGASLSLRHSLPERCQGESDLNKRVDPVVWRKRMGHNKRKF
jgi:hypothetical protein